MIIVEHGHLPGHGRGVHGLGGGSERSGDLCQAKIENFRLAAFDEKDICGLDASVDDALGMRRIKAIRDLDAGFRRRAS
jgi:hypothetical protein